MCWSGLQLAQILEEGVALRSPKEKHWLGKKGTDLSGAPWHIPGRSSSPCSPFPTSPTQDIPIPTTAVARLVTAVIQECSQHGLG